MVSLCNDADLACADPVQAPTKNTIMLSSRGTEATLVVPAKRARSVTLLHLGEIDELSVSSVKKPARTTEADTRTIQAVIREIEFIRRAGFCRISSQ